MQQMHILTTKVPSVMLRSKKIENPKKKKNNVKTERAVG
jgi:hypothetical protein